MVYQALSVTFKVNFVIFEGLRGHFLAEEIRRYVSKIRSKHIINSSLNISLYTIMMRLKCLSMAPINLCQFFPMVIGLLFHLFITLYAATSNLGPERPATQGSIWPKPRFEKRFQFYFTIDTNQLQFQVRPNFQDYFNIGIYPL